MEMKKITRLSMLLALSVVLSIIESFLPLFNGMVIPGVKLGLANTVLLCSLTCFTFKDTLFLAIARVFLVSILRTGLFSMNFYFSLFGTLLAVFTMAFLKKTTKLSIIGISIGGSFMHSFGQILTAFFFLNNEALFFYLPFILLFSIPTGMITGIIAKELTKYLQKIL